MSEIQIGLRNRSSGTKSPVTLSAARNAGGVLNFLLLIPGLLTCMTARMLYPLLDDDVAFGFMVVLFLLPFIVQLIVIVRKQANARVLRLAFGCSACALFVFALLLLLNGGMDNSPQTTMRASVVSKTVLTGRYGSRQYHLIVSSWRPGKRSEDLSVTSRVFNHAPVGSTVAVEVHPGYLGMPWSGRVSVE